MYFLPAFYDVMVHLCVHIVDDIIDLGPTFLHSMMPFERMNGVIKGFVRNMSRPQGNRQHQRREVEEDTTYGAHAPKEVAQ